MPCRAEAELAEATCLGLTQVPSEYAHCLHQLQGINSSYRCFLATFLLWLQIKLHSVFHSLQSSVFASIFMFAWTFELVSHTARSLARSLHSNLSFNLCMSFTFSHLSHISSSISLSSLSSLCLCFRLLSITLMATIAVSEHVRLPICIFSCIYIWSVYLQHNLWLAHSTR